MIRYFIDLIKSISIYSIINIYNIFIGILVLPFFTRYFSVSTYGTIGLITMILLLMNNFADQGLNIGYSRYFYEYAKDKVKQDRLFVSTILCMGMIPLLYLGIYLPFSDFFTNLLLHEPQFENTILVVLLLIIVMNLNKTPFLKLRMENRNRTYVGLVIIQATIDLILKFLFVFYYELQVTGIFFAQLCAQSSILIPLYVLAAKDIRTFRPSFAFMKPILQFSRPYIILLLGFWFIDSADRYILSLFVSKAELGIYHIGYQYAQLILVIIAAFQLAWPQMYMQYYEQQKDQFLDFIGKVCLYFTVAMLFLVLLIQSGAKIFLTYFTASDYQVGFKFTIFILAAYALKGIYLILIAPLFMKKLSKVQVKIELFALSISTGFIILLAYYFGIMGAAIATFISYLNIIIFTFIYNRKYEIKIIFPLQKYFKIIASFIFAAVLIVMFDYYYSIFVALVFKAIVLALFALVMIQTFYQEYAFFLGAVQAKLKRKNA